MLREQVLDDRLRRRRGVLDVVLLGGDRESDLLERLHGAIRVVDDRGYRRTADDDHLRSLRDALANVGRSAITHAAAVGPLVEDRRVDVQRGAEVDDRNAGAARTLVGSTSRARI